MRLDLKLLRDSLVVTMKEPEDHQLKHQRMLEEERSRNSQIRKEIEEAKDKQYWEKVRFWEEHLAISNKRIDDLTRLIEMEKKRKIIDQHNLWFWFG